MSIVNVWAPTMKTCWSRSHIRTKYSSNRTWALMPVMQKYFKRPQSLSAAMVGGWFSALALSSSCSHSFHSNTMIVASNLHKKHINMVNDLINEINIFYWLNVAQFFELCIVRRRPTLHSENFSQAAFGPPARMSHSRRSHMGHLRECLQAHRVQKTSLKLNFLPMKLNF